MAWPVDVPELNLNLASLSDKTLAPLSSGILVAPKRSKASPTASRTPLSSSVRTSCNAGIESRSPISPSASAAAARTSAEESSRIDDTNGSVNFEVDRSAFSDSLANSPAASARTLASGESAKSPASRLSSSFQTWCSGARDRALPEAVGSKVTQPRCWKGTSAHWWAWSEYTAWEASTSPIAHPVTTLAGIPADRASNTKALLNWPHVPSLLSNRNQSTGSCPA